jgi:hypothetical protein
LVLFHATPDPRQGNKHAKEGKKKLRSTTRTHNGGGITATHCSAELR